MAERRMFAKTIIFSDDFLDMPLSARCLYFSLGMMADDDGFVNSPKAIMRQCGSSTDDLKLLIAKSFILQFDSGVIVVKHWRIHNYIRKDTYNETSYKEEKSMLCYDENKAYVFASDDCQRIVDEPLTQDRIGKDRIGKDRIGKDRIGKDKAGGELVFYAAKMELNDAIHDFIEMRKKIKKPMTDHAIDLFLKKLDKISGADDELAIKIIEESILKSWTDIYPLKDDFKPKQNNNKIDWDNV